MSLHVELLDEGLRHYRNQSGLAAYQRNIPKVSFRLPRKSSQNLGREFRTLRVSSPSVAELSWSDVSIPLGREITEEVAARTDQQNEFPAGMWKKLGEAGYEPQSD